MELEVVRTSKRSPIPEPFEALAENLLSRMIPEANHHARIVASRDDIMKAAALIRERGYDINVYPVHPVVHEVIIKHRRFKQD